jgi:hypothetical protein
MSTGPEGGVLLMERPALLVHGTCTIVPYAGSKNSALLSPKKASTNSGGGDATLDAMSPLSADDSMSSSAFFGDSVDVNGTPRGTSGTSDAAISAVGIPARSEVLHAVDRQEQSGPFMLRAANTRFEGGMIGSGGRCVLRC